MISVIHYSLDIFNELFAALSHSTEGDDRVAFGKIVGDGESFAVGFEAVGGAFDEVVGGFAFGGVDYFQALGGGWLGGAGGGAAAVKEKGDGRVRAVGVLGELGDERIAGARSVARLAGGKVAPSVQETVAVHQNAHNGHG